MGFGTVLNQVQNAYNDFGQQTNSYQAHVGSVNISTTPKVQYSYASGSGNTIRMTGMTYPNGRALTYDYGITGGMNDACSRIESVINASDSLNLATYQYLGTSGFVHVASGQPGINWTLIGTVNDPNTGDIYSGLDRFGRVDNCLRGELRGGGNSGDTRGELLGGTPGGGTPGGTPGTQDDT